VAPSAALGMRRLSIIDLPADTNPYSTKQAMSASSLTVKSITSPLRKRLEERGIRSNKIPIPKSSFPMKSGANSACANFAACLPLRYGCSVFPALREMRAPRAVCSWRATAWDQAALLAFADGALLFASEVRALIASGRVASRIAPDSLDRIVIRFCRGATTLVEGYFHFLRTFADASLMLLPQSQSRKPYWILRCRAFEWTFPPRTDDAAKLRPCSKRPLAIT